MFWSSKKSDTVTLAVLVLTTFVVYVNCQTESEHFPGVTFTTEDESVAEYQVHPENSTIIKIKKSGFKLKVCGDDVSGEALTLPKGATTVQIPTFSLGRLQYLMGEHELDRHQPLDTCNNGQKPNKSPVISTVSKPIFDEEYADTNHSIVFIYKMLRSLNFLLDSGYLSVGYADQTTAEYFAPHEFCLAGIQGQGEETIADFRTCPFSASRPKLKKCCPINMVVADGFCVEYTPSKKWDLTYLDPSTNTFLSIDQVDPVYSSAFVPCKVARDRWYPDNCLFDYHPTTDNRLAFIGARRDWKFFHVSKRWCIDMVLDDKGGVIKEKTVLVHCDEDATPKSPSKVSFLYMVNMYVGAFFHLLTTLVYLITWRKQNFHGKTVCSCTASLLFMQFFMGTSHLLGLLKIKILTTVCIVNSVGGHYCMIAAFTWLLVVNFDLWWTFRSVRTAGGKSLKRFLSYSAFGWGFPLVVVLVSVTLNYTFKCPASRVLIPDYGEYYCFVAPWAQGVYVYYILGVLIGTSCVFAGLTLYSVYRSKSEAVNLRTNKREADQQNVLLYLKLSVVMGLSWAFEVISWASIRENGSNSILWIVIDFYNALSAILIFMIFVCKSSTRNLLEQSIPQLKVVTATLSRATLPSFSSSTNENTYSTMTSGCGTTNNSGKRGAPIPLTVSNSTGSTKSQQATTKGHDNTAFQ